MKQLIAFALILFFAGCKKEKIDPHQAILGKWEEFYLGNGEYQPWRESTGYRHFMEDSVLVDFNYKDKWTTKKKYWIDSLLISGHHLMIIFIGSGLTDFVFKATRCGWICKIPPRY